MKKRRAVALFCCNVISTVASFSADCQYSALHHPAFRSSSSRKPLERPSTALRYDASSDEDHIIELPTLSNATRDILNEWLYSLPKLERSEPDWIKRDILTFSPSALLQEQLTQLCPIANSMNLFETESSRTKFDLDWRNLVLKSTPSLDLPDVLEEGRSNTHPLRLQLIAFPPHCDLKVHVHAAVEVAVPMFGVYCQRRTSAFFPRDQLWRRPEHAIGTPLSSFSETPTPEELTMIREDLSQRAYFPNVGSYGKFVSECSNEGQCVVNKVGSVHQTYTSDSPCLLWVLGPNVQAHFLPGNFDQTEGIDELTDIYDSDLGLG
jgi:hypothetical protein